ncbi:MAG TPA: OmpA family protein [Hanamia sp.]|nr:OmpA family protein [Hanamia sp.]
MLKVLFSSALFYIQFIHISVAQTNAYVKNPAIGIHFIENDFKGADYIRNNSLFAAFRNKQFANSKNMKPGLSVDYLQGVSSHFDFSVTLAGSYLDYTLHNGSILGHGSLLLETDASLIAKLFTDRHWVSPYLLAGIGTSKYNSYYGLFIPFGIGLQVNFSNEVYLIFNNQYRIGITNKVNDHFYYSIGIAGNIIKKKRKHAVRNSPLVSSLQSFDRDKDGIPDSVDVCLEVAGLKQFNGCPDSDGDGIPDNEDKCPLVPGVLKYHGCPVPDTDGDGINDDNDSCKTIPGVIKYHGCPIPDSDGDGINDEEDKCPLEPGPKENHGCPVLSNALVKKVELAAQRIFFKTGSFELLEKSFQSLDEVATVLKTNPSVQLLIEGHTDNVGSREKNQLLSENRARAVMEYLIEKNGISKDRLTIKGYGFSKPVATNATSEGRALNRRVELSLFY